MWISECEEDQKCEGVCFWWLYSFTDWLIEKLPSLTYYNKVVIFVIGMLLS